jgi:hypothetical protein
MQVLPYVQGLPVLFSSGRLRPLAAPSMAPFRLPTRSLHFKTCCILLTWLNKKIRSYEPDFY